MVAVILPDIISHIIKLENILSFMDFGCLVILVGCNIWQKTIKRKGNLKSH